MGIKIVCRNPNLTNIKSDGTIDDISQMIISILSIMATFERKMILERQREGIAIAKTKGLHRGRKVGISPPLPCGITSNWESLFIVFRKPINHDAACTTKQNFPNLTEMLELDGSRKVAFDPQWEGPAEITYEK